MSARAGADEYCVGDGERWAVGAEAGHEAVCGLSNEKGAHAGCRTRFGPYGYLWIATGDGGGRCGTDSQNLSTLGGQANGTCQRGPGTWYSM